jgi:type III restriction enzyme
MRIASTVAIPELRLRPLRSSKGDPPVRDVERGLTCGGFELTYWVPGVNHLGTYGRWAFSEFTEIYQLETDLAEKIETEFARMIETASGRELTPLTLFMNRSEFCVSKQFGQQSHLAQFSRGIWRRIDSHPDRSIRLSDVQAVATETSCNVADALAVMSLLTNSSVGLLRLEMRSIAPHGGSINPAEFVQKLSDWWRDRKISDAEWKEWATKVEVKWLPSSLRKEST